AVQIRGLLGCRSCHPTRCRTQWLFDVELFARMLRIQSAEHARPAHRPRGAGFSNAGRSSPLTLDVPGATKLRRPLTGRYLSSGSPRERGRGIHMRSVSSFIVAVTTLALAFLVSGCHENPTAEPTLLGARSAANKVTLQVLNGGSTAGGLVTSNRGGISCTLSTASGGTAVSGKCTQTFKTGTIVTLTAAPTGTGTQVTWSGCTGASDSPLACEVTLDFSRNVVVTFSPPPLSQLLTIASGASGSGHVTSSVPGINCTITNGAVGSSGCSAAYPTGQAMTLTATAASGSYLKAWAGAGCDAAGTGVGSGSGTCAITMDAPKNVVTSFDQQATVAALGKWDAPTAWPAVAIHTHLLPDGRVLTWSRSSHAPVLWNPASPGSFGGVAEPADLFCSGHSFLPDG